ncbi:unnamed protein product [Moneuplotes crassus]|uniref:Uncharacterized protein n=1 Tax=Euplotes crassus TaxID=5936 RepID=A0AAD1XJJ0_EUPCR|nr:unnamed protein product [Moneuplotes crassus]
MQKLLSEDNLEKLIKEDLISVVNIVKLDNLGPMQEQGVQIQEESHDSYTHVRRGAESEDYIEYETLRSSRS